MNDRLRQIIDYYNINVRKFSSQIGVNESTIRKILAKNTSIQSDNLQKIAVNFPEINLDWLITGRGNMIFSELDDKKLTTVQPPVNHDPSVEKLQAIADEKERTIHILANTNRELLDEVHQLRQYVNTTSTKYIQIVEQTLEAARQTNATVQQFQASIGFHHNDSNHHRIAAHHPNDQDPK